MYLSKWPRVCYATFATTTLALAAHVYIGTSIVSFAAGFLEDRFFFYAAARRLRKVGNIFYSIGNELFFCFFIQILIFTF